MILGLAQGMDTLYGMGGASKGRRLRCGANKGWDHWNITVLGAG